MPWLTEEVHYEAVAIAIDIGGRVRLELDGDVRSGGVELKVRLRPSILTQHFGCEVVSVIKGQQVILPDVQPATRDAPRVKICPKSFPPQAPLGSSG